MTDSGKQSWFERNPKKTLLFFLLFVMIVFIFAAEKILAYKQGVSEDSPIRYIRLREHPPHTNTKQEFGELNEDGSKKFYQFRTDDNGFIEPSIVHENPDKTIVFLGGSTTECFAVDEDKRFPYLSGRLLEKKTGLKVNSINSGVMGNHSMHSIDILLNKIVPMKPDIAVMMHNTNDLSILIHEGTYWSKNPYRSLLVQKEGLSTFYLIRSIKNMTIPHLYEFIKEKVNLGLIVGNMVNQKPVDEFAASRGKKIELDFEKLSSVFRSNLELFVRMCKIYGIEPVLMTQANRYKETLDPEFDEMIKKLSDKGLDYQEYKKVYEGFNQTIRDVGSEMDVLVVDLDKAIPKERQYLKDVVHYKTAGSVMAAEAIAENMTSLLAQER